MEAITSRDEDSRWIRWSVAVAVGLHLVLFAIQWPLRPGALAEAKRPRHQPIMVVMRYPPPRERPPMEQLRPPARRVPIPDPTPEQAEPIRDLEAPISVTTDLDDTVWARLVTPPPPPEPERNDVLLVGGAVSRPLRVGGLDPHYPEAARAARMEGRVILSCVVHRDGRVGEIEVIEGAALGMTEAEIAAVRTWVYEPARLDGSPVDARFVVTVRFDLRRQRS